MIRVGRNLLDIRRTAAKKLDISLWTDVKKKKPFKVNIIRYPMLLSDKGTLYRDDCYFINMTMFATLLMGNYYYLVLKSNTNTT